MVTCLQTEKTTALGTQVHPGWSMQAETNTEEEAYSPLRPELTLFLWLVAMKLCVSVVDRICLFCLTVSVLSPWLIGPMALGL